MIGKVTLTATNHPGEGFVVLQLPLASATITYVSNGQSVPPQPAGNFPSPQGAPFQTRAVYQAFNDYDVTAIDFKAPVAAGIYSLGDLAVALPGIVTSATLEMAPSPTSTPALAPISAMRSGTVADYPCPQTTGPSPCPGPRPTPPCANITDCKNLIQADLLPVAASSKGAQAAAAADADLVSDMVAQETTPSIGTFVNSMYQALVCDFNADHTAMRNCTPAPAPQAPPLVPSQVSGVGSPCAPQVCYPGTNPYPTASPKMGVPPYEPAYFSSQCGIWIDCASPESRSNGAGQTSCTNFDANNARFTCGTNGAWLAYRQNFWLDNAYSGFNGTCHGTRRDSHGNTLYNQCEYMYIASLWGDNGWKNWCDTDSTCTNVNSTRDGNILRLQQPPNVYDNANPLHERGQLWSKLWAEHDPAYCSSFGNPPDANPYPVTDPTMQARSLALDPVGAGGIDVRYPEKWSDWSGKCGGYQHTIGGYVRDIYMMQYPGYGKKDAPMIAKMDEWVQNCDWSYTWAVGVDAAAMPNVSVSPSRSCTNSVWQAFYIANAFKY